MELLFSWRKAINVTLRSVKKKVAAHSVEQGLVQPSCKNALFSLPLRSWSMLRRLEWEGLRFHTFRIIYSYTYMHILPERFLNELVKCNGRRRSAILIQKFTAARRTMRIGCLQCCILYIRHFSVAHFISLPWKYSGAPLYEDAWLRAHALEFGSQSVYAHFLTVRHHSNLYNNLDRDLSNAYQFSHSY